MKKEKQNRSTLTENKILATAKELFSTKGFYNVSTNEIAKTSSISIGTLYHHFENKNDILDALLERQNEEFKKLFALGNPASDARIKEMRSNPRKWLKNIIQMLIDMHQNDLAFIKELDSLYHNLPKVKKQQDAHTQAFQNQAYELAKYYKDDLNTEDLKAFSLVFYGFITSLVDQVVLYPSQIEDDRLLKSGIDSLMVIMEQASKKTTYD